MGAQDRAEDRWSRRRESNPRPCSREKSDGARLPLPGLDSPPNPLPLRVPWSPLQSPGVPPVLETCWRRLQTDYLRAGSSHALALGLPVSLRALQDHLEDARSRHALPPPVPKACPSPNPREANASQHNGDGDPLAMSATTARESPTSIGTIWMGISPGTLATPTSMETASRTRTTALRSTRRFRRRPARSQASS